MFTVRQSKRLFGLIGAAALPRRSLAALSPHIVPFIGTRLAHAVSQRFFVCFGELAPHECGSFKDKFTGISSHKNEPTEAPQSQSIRN
ncbi:MAG: hypothetical protein R3E08_02605 [Thiotrichaceae bacterium]